MTLTIHKILIHGSTVIKQASLPIGQMSEKTPEAGNKHFRLCWQNYARMFSREACDRSVINRLILSWAPILVLQECDAHWKRYITISERVCGQFFLGEPTCRVDH